MAVATIDPDVVWADFREQVAAEKAERLKPPLVRFWDGSWNLRGVVTRINSANVQWVDNETGVADFVLPLDYWMSEWIVNDDERDTKNVHVTIDKDGARWSGRMEKFTVKKNNDGTGVLELRFKHDYEELKHILVYSNPWLPPEVQFPRLWLLFGPARWALKTTLLVNIVRLYSAAWAIPPDPMNPSGWDSLDQSTWWMAVKPGSIDGDNSLPSIVHSRFKYMHDVAKNIVEDAQLSWEFRRYLDGDPPPWEGAELRHGCLVIDLVDKSGFTSGTSFGGDLFGGLIRAFINVDADGLTEGVDIINDPNMPAEYSDPGFLGTLPEAPWVIYRDGENSGIQESGFTKMPATAVGVVAGGHSMPGVNELISATIQMVGDLTAMIPGVPPLGGIADALLKPLYCVAGDTIIDGPDGKERIDVLAERGGSFRVWSVTPDGRKVPAEASFAFKKGHAELFEYTLANARTLTATAHHRWLTRNGWAEAFKTPIGTEVATVGGSLCDFEDAPKINLNDAAWSSVPDSRAVVYSPVVSVRSVGWQDFYDMTVPGWVNYAGNGIWNHNTDVFLAFGKWRNQNRATSLGGSHYHEIFAEGGDRAYTLAWLLAMRTGMWTTREQVSHTVVVADGAPYRIGQQGYGHFFLGDRIGSTVRGMKPGRVFVDRVSELTFQWDRDTEPTWNITVGSRAIEDPVIKAWEKLQEMLSILRDLGVL